MMDLLYKLCCIPRPPPVDINELKGANFNQFLNLSLKSSDTINQNPELKTQAQHEWAKLISNKSNSPKNTIRTLNTLFDTAAQHTHDRDMVEWLRVLVTTTVEASLTEPISEKPKKKNNSPQYHQISISDDEYVPSDDGVVPVSKPARKKKTDQQVPSGQKGTLLPVLKEGAGSKALAKYFLDMGTTNTSALGQGYFARSFFFPSKDSFNAFLSVLNSATKKIDICVFAFTDDDVADALIAAKKRGVDIRIITDNQQAAGKGADAKRLQQDYGIPYKTDNTTGYMHNKFAIVDNKTLINGSFNWSKGARFKNRENVMITNIPACIADFQAQFDSLWKEF